MDELFTNDRTEIEPGLISKLSLWGPPTQTALNVPCSLEFRNLHYKPVSKLIDSPLYTFLVCLFMQSTPTHKWIEEFTVCCCVLEANHSTPGANNPQQCLQDLKTEKNTADQAD